MTRFPVFLKTVALACLAVFAVGALSPALPPLPLFSGALSAQEGEDDENDFGCYETEAGNWTFGTGSIWQTQEECEEVVACLESAEFRAWVVSRDSALIGMMGGVISGQWWLVALALVGLFASYYSPPCADLLTGQVGGGGIGEGE